jgi:hypothetical protein
MISTLYFIQLIAFYLWQLTSKSAKRSLASALTANVLQNKKIARILGGVLLLITAIGFVLTLGLLSGLCSFMIGLMAVGCLSVALEPFNYLRLPGVAILYICSVALEIFI